MGSFQTVPAGSVHPALLMRKLGLLLGAEAPVMTPNGMDFSFCRQYVQVKTGQELPREGADAALDEVLANYRTELGLSDKEAEQLEHLQVSYPACLRHPQGPPRVVCQAAFVTCSAHLGATHTSFSSSSSCHVMLRHVLTVQVCDTQTGYALQGTAKVQRLVAILRSHQFMERYQAEISARDERIKESKRLG